MIELVSLLKQIVALLVNLAQTVFAIGAWVFIFVLGIANWIEYEKQKINLGGKE